MFSHDRRARHATDTDWLQACARHGRHQPVPTCMQMDGAHMHHRAVITHKHDPGRPLGLCSRFADGLPVSGDLHRKVTWEALATLMPTDCSVSRKCCRPSGPGVYVILCVTPRYRTLITLAAGLSSVGVRAGRQSGSTALQNRHRVSSLRQATGFSQEAPAVNSEGAGWGTHLRPAEVSCHLARHDAWTVRGQEQGRTSGWSSFGPSRHIQQVSSSASQEHAASAACSITAHASDMRATQNTDPRYL
jgi:hypothetical protein